VERERTLDKVISIAGGPEIFTHEVMAMLDRNRKEAGLKPIDWKLALGEYFPNEEGK
jgi:hypothetical protein